ncbi:MAG: hypothetical protein LBE21_01255 [Pseudomonadales bacterium]|jgi:hypothetical protein|nr:hypothetical protein [Pseudomonadales bacterium]
MNSKILIGAGAAAVAVLVVGGYFFVNQKADVKADEFVAALNASGQYDNVSYDSVDVSPTGVITMSNLRLEQNGQKSVLQNLRINDYDYSHETPWHIDMEIEGVQFPDGIDALFAQSGSEPMPPEVRDLLFKGDTMPIKMRFNYNYEPDDNNQIEFKSNFGFPDVVSFNMDGTLRGVAIENFDSSQYDPTDPTAAMVMMSELMGTAEIPSLTLSFADDGFLDFALNTAAAQNGISPEDARALMISQVSSASAMVPPEAQALVQSISAEVVEFLAGGSTLEIRINPELGGSIAQLQPQIMGAVFTGDFNQIAELLHLEVENKR